MSLINMIQTVPAQYMDLKTIVTLDAHQTVLGTEEVSVLPITGQMADKHLGNFWGLLDDLMVPKKFHWVVANLNGIRESGDFKADLTSIIIPSFTMIDRIIRQDRNQTVQ